MISPGKAAIGPIGLQNHSNDHTTDRVPSRFFDPIIKVSINPAELSKEAEHRNTEFFSQIQGDACVSVDMEDPVTTSLPPSRLISLSSA